MTGENVRQSQQSRGRVVRVIEVRAVVVSVIGGMSGTISDRMLVHDLVIVIGVNMGRWQHANQRHRQGGNTSHRARHPTR